MTFVLLGFLILICLAVIFFLSSNGLDDMLIGAVGVSAAIIMSCTVTVITLDVIELRKEQTNNAQVETN